MKLSYLLKNIKPLEIRGDVDKEISSICCHSKQVTRGSLFFALKGSQTDGSFYIKEAIARGALGVVYEDNWAANGDSQTTFIRVKDGRKALATIAARFYEYPAKSLNLIGITGTNGKTTTSHLIASILKAVNKPVGIIGTIGYFIGNRFFKASLTTPDALTLQQLFKEMKEQGIADVVMEVSSHSLVYQRIAGCSFKLGIFTNLSHDHLDFHQDMEHYYQAKRRLFADYLSSKGVAVINADDSWGQRLIKEIDKTVIDYGIERHATVYPKTINLSLNGIQTTIVTPKGEIEINSPLIGKPNLYNILTAVASGVALDMPLSRIKEGIEAVKGIAGRLECICQKGLTVVIDYAHTPDALKQVLETLRSLTSHRIITVFGCGGNRDKQKRPIMGQIASSLSDWVVITNDNPRQENPRQIIQDIEMGIDRKRPYSIVPDRRQAILWAIKQAQKGDVVLVAGKGHEDYQIIGDKRYHFSDKEEVLKALAEL